MSSFTVNTPRPTPIRALSPAERVAALADGGAVIALDAPRPSPHLARFGIRPQDDDGISIARIAIAGTPALVAAQDERFLGGSVGANHGTALHDIFVRARAERPAGVVLLLASGGVRLHEANAGELWLARALRALLDTRAAGVPVLAVATGHVFGGASVLACAADRLAMLPGTRIGVSGPKVIQSVHGKWELDADRPSDVDAVFGATARSAAGDVDLVADDADALRAWIRVAFAQTQPFAERVASTHALLAARVPPCALRAELPFTGALAAARPEDSSGWLWGINSVLATRPAGNAPFGAAFAHALDGALLARFREAPHVPSTRVLIVEDSAGHEVSRAAEMRFLSRSLAHHAAVLALLRARGHRLSGLLAGTGHSAAFFVNALQASPLYALPHARVVAMEPSAIARITGLRAGTLIEDDPLLGQPVRHLAALGGVDEILHDDRLASLLAGEEGMR
jgi:malonate decarboxylase beta subunit